MVLSESLLLGSERRLSFSAHSSPCEDAHRRDALIRQIAPRIWPLEKSHDFAYVIHWQNGAKVKIQSRRQHVAHWRLRDHLPHLCPLHRSIVCPYSLAFPAAPRASLTRGPELSLLPGGAPRFSRPHQHLSHPRPHPTLQSSRVFLPRGVALLVFRGDVSHATDSFFFPLSLSPKRVSYLLLPSRSSFRVLSPSSYVQPSAISSHAPSNCLENFYILANMCFRDCASIKYNVKIKMVCK